MTFALPTVQNVKDYLKITNTVEDTLLAALLVSAQAMVEAYINRPIIASLQTDVDPADTFAAYGVVRVLQTSVWPIAPADAEADPPVLALTCTDVDGIALEAGTDFTVNLKRGTVNAINGATFDNGPYTLVYVGGVSAFPTWETVQGPIVAQAILDTVSDLYTNRSPNSSSESENGVSVTWGQGAMSTRTMKLLAAVSPVPFI